MAIQQRAGRPELSQNLIVRHPSILSFGAVDRAHQGLQVKVVHYLVEVFEIMYFDQDVEIKEIASSLLGDHLQRVDIGARIADYLGDLRQRADLIVNLHQDTGGKALS